jgi:hypothetical protein
VEVRAEQIQALLRADNLNQPPELVAAYTATTVAAVAVINAFTTQIATLQGQVEACLAATRTRRFTGASLASVRSSVPGLAQQFLGPR